MDFWFVIIFVAVAVGGLVVSVLLLSFLVNSAAIWFRREYTERAVIGQIATVLRQNLPLSTALALAAESETGWARRYLQRIARLTGQGLTLAESLRLAYPDCPSLALSLVDAGQQVGQLRAAVEQAEDHLMERARRDLRPDAPVWIYVVAIGGFTMTLVAGIMVAVVPKFKEIFQDFQTDLPGLTKSLIGVSDWFVQGTPPGWTVFALPGLLVAYLLLRRRRRPEVSAISRLGDWWSWHMPGARRKVFGEGMTAALRTVRLAVRSGMDLEPAARLAAGLDLNLYLRRRWRRFADLLASGTPLEPACRAADLGQVTSTALLAGQRTGDMDAALRYAADYHETVFSRWWIFLTRLAWPLATLAMASIVGYVVLALFLPLVALINSTAGRW